MTADDHDRALGDDKPPAARGGGGRGGNHAHRVPASSPRAGSAMSRASPPATALVGSDLSRRTATNLSEFLGSFLDRLSEFNGDSWKAGDGPGSSDGWPKRKRCAMLWEVEIRPLGRDRERERVCDEFDLLTHAQRGGDLVSGSARGLPARRRSRRSRSRTTHERVARRSARGNWSRPSPVGGESGHYYTVLLKPGVMDPVAQTVLDRAQHARASRCARSALSAATSARRKSPSPDRDVLFRKVLANDAIEQVVVGPVKADHLALGSAYTFKLVQCRRSRARRRGPREAQQGWQLALTLDEMKAVQAHFRELGREPTDIELETIAQTWSEHCSHKTLKGTDPLHGHDRRARRGRYKNLLKETIFAATQEIRKRLGADDWCVSVFADNAGVVKFDDENHALLQGRDAQPPVGHRAIRRGEHRPRRRHPRSARHRPRREADLQHRCLLLRPARTSRRNSCRRACCIRGASCSGVVAGVRDYGNRMGIPTVNGAVVFDERYLANPLVFCGTVGIIPADKAFKQVNPGDLIVAVGGRTGRDGIHGATFSSLELTHESETVSGGAVQIGNAITEKKVLDVILQARDRGLFTAITDCGAGGFSSAVGEMGAELGATVNLEAAPAEVRGAELHRDLDQRVAGAHGAGRAAGEVAGTASSSATARTSRRR